MSIRLNKQLHNKSAAVVKLLRFQYIVQIMRDIRATALYVRSSNVGRQPLTVLFLALHNNDHYQDISRDRQSKSDIVDHQ